MEGVVFRNVIRLCEKTGTSVYALEKALGFSKASIPKWENSDPGTARVKAVADYFGVTVDELLREEDDDAEQ